MSDDLIERLRGPVKQAALDLIDVYFGNSRKILATIPADESRDADLLLVKGIKEAADELDRLRAENERLRGALEGVDRCATYPVCTTINPRGYDVRPPNKELVELIAEIVRAALAKETGE